ncbi:MAG: tryptophan--tRNA ligase, partial [Alphaproteobacteria bacterium]|nr:tryptophan--tRNA ligase [Alphaproteobacteria bacterium]
MRVLSGIQPTGNLHLGNYLGAIRNWVKMQDEMDLESQCFFFLADMHSITVHEGREQRIRNVRDMAAALVAAGIDPDRSVLFNQARVPAHAELCWLLNGTARIGWLNRMTQFKDTAGKDREGASVGLFVYPVL